MKTKNIADKFKINVEKFKAGLGYQTAYQALASSDILG